MFYAISVPLIMPENMLFRPYSYSWLFGTLIFDGWSTGLNMCSYASMKMTLRIMAVNTLTFTPT